MVSLDTFSWKVFSVALYGVLSGKRAEREGSGGLLGGGGIGGVESGVRVSGVCGGMCSSTMDLMDLILSIKNTE